MNVAGLLEDLNQKNIQLWTNGDKLNIRCPKGVLTPDLRAELNEHKAKIITFLREVHQTEAAELTETGLSLQTIGHLIGGSTGQSCKQPIIDPTTMAQKLAVTFRPLPDGYRNDEIIKFRAKLMLTLKDYGVTIQPWDEVLTELTYEIPIFKWKKKVKTKVVKAGVNAVIDVERYPSLWRKLGISLAETFYRTYSYFTSKHRATSVLRIAALSSWAEDHAAKYIEDPTNTQVIMLTLLDTEFTNPKLPYQQKIKIGLNTLVRTFSELVIGVSREKISILNMNLSDSMYSMDKVDQFVLNSLIPKVYVPIIPIPMTQFELGQYDPRTSTYAEKLVVLGRELADTGLFPPGAKLSEVIPRKSHRDIVNVIVNGRTGVSYGFVAYAEPPQYIGAAEIDESEWEALLPADEFSMDEVRQNELGRRYIRTKVDTHYVFKQIPDLWIVSSRSGSNKTDLNLEQDVLRVGLSGEAKLLLQMPQNVDPKVSDIKPSYDLYVMLAIALASSLYAPALVHDGLPMVHFHGYPSLAWFGPDDHYAGVHNPSVPCGTYESGVFNFLSIYSLATKHSKDIALASLIEPDHGTNIIAHDLDYLIGKLKDGCEKNQIELGGKYFVSLKESLVANRINHES
jgi:TubC N-terminal docking domain